MDVMPEPSATSINTTRGAPCSSRVEIEGVASVPRNTVVPVVGLTYHQEYQITDDALTPTGDESVNCVVRSIPWRTLEDGVPDNIGVLAIVSDRETFTATLE